LDSFADLGSCRLSGSWLVDSILPEAFMKRYPFAPGHSATSLMTLPFQEKTGGFNAVSFQLTCKNLFVKNSGKPKSGKLGS